MESWPTGTVARAVGKTHGRQQLRASARPARSSRCGRPGELAPDGRFSATESSGNSCGSWYTGTIAFEGAPVTIASTGDAIALGIATVYQEPQLFPELTVSENIFTGREIRRGGRVAWAEQNAKVVELLELLGLPARYATVPVGELSIAEQQQVSIAKSLAGDAKVLILDEPSAILTDAEIEVLFTVVRRLTGRGRRGHLHLAPARRAVPHRRRGDRHARRPDHRHLPDRRPRRPPDRGADGRRDPLRRAAAPRGPRRRAGAGPRRARPRRASSTTSTSRCGAGEIVCLYGLVGSGVSEIAACVYGIDRPTERRDAPARHADRAAVAAGRRSGTASRCCPRTARSRGCSASSRSRSTSPRATSSCCRGSACSWTGPASARSPTDMIKRLAVRTPHERQPISAMSGGNAQKVVLARQLVERPEVLVLAEPTQGVDVGAKEEIHRIITELADDRARPCSSSPRTCPRRCASPTGCWSCGAAPPPSSSDRTPPRSTCSPPRRGAVEEDVA